MTQEFPSREKLQLPQEPVQRFIKPLVNFLHIEAASGGVLALCTLVALLLANSPWAEQYLAIWNLECGLTFGRYQVEHSLKHWINDGLMAIFFFVIGLEVKREIVLGELRKPRRAALPIAAAMGGMLVPAGIYLALQMGEAGQRGWGIPMATDIAFVVGLIAVLGSRIPAALRVMLLSLAIVDDIGAILVIAFGYTETIHWPWLVMGLGGIGVVVVMQRLGVRAISMYTFTGLLIWLGFHESGIHATIAGVVLGLQTPARPYLEDTVAGQFLDRASEAFHEGTWHEDSHRVETIRQYQRVTRETISPVEYLIFLLHPWVAFLIMPIFALANAGVPLKIADIATSTSVAVIVALAVGKPLGILLFCWVSVKLRIAQLPASFNWWQIVGSGFLAGVGFTMAMFVSGLAFPNSELLKTAKVGVLVGSLISAVFGVVILMLAAKYSPSDAEED